LQLQWTAPGDDGINGDIVSGAFEIRYSTDAALTSYQLITVSTSCGAGEASYYTVTDLTGDTSYYFAIRVADERGNWSELSNTATGWTLDNVPPEAPTSLVATAGDAEVQLIWSASSSNDVTEYRLYRSTDNSIWSLVISTDTTSYLDTGLTNLTTYWYFVKAVDFYGNESSSSPVASAMPYSVDKIAPLPPAGIYGEISSDGLTFTLHFSSVVTNEDRTPCTDVAGYHLWASTGIFAPFTSVSTTTSLSFTVARATDTVMFYALTSFDKTTPVANESEMSMFVDDSEDMNLWIVSTDAVVRVPSKAGEILRQGFDDDAVVEIQRDTAEENYPQGRILRSIDFNAKKNNSGAAVNFAFDSKIEVEIFYKVSSDSTITSLDINESEAEKSLALFWFNGVEWIKLGGEVDADRNSVKTFTNHLGRFQLRVSKRSDKFSVFEGPIPKIITPNGDGLNDFCQWTFDNPNEYAPSGEIFDIRGRKVADMKLGLDISNNSGTLSWDGTDLNGRFVAPGVYIWQIKAEGKVYNGTVVVAR